ANPQGSRHETGRPQKLHHAMCFGLRQSHSGSRPLTTAHGGMRRASEHEQKSTLVDPGKRTMTGEPNVKINVGKAGAAIAVALATSVAAPAAAQSVNWE